MFSFFRKSLVLLCCFLVSPVIASDSPPKQEDASQQKTQDVKKTKTKKKKKPGKKKKAGKKKTEEKKPTDTKPTEKVTPPESSELPAAKEPAVDKSKYAVTELDKVDRDFEIQGEYAGTVQPDLEHSDRGALQVVALGDGKFAGLLFRGGLPGAGWDRSTRQKVVGQRDRNGVTLKNDKWSVAIGKDGAIVRDAKGKPWGTFSKVHRISTTQDAPPIAGSLVLFDGRGNLQFDNAKVTEDGLLHVGPTTKMPVHDFQMHLEFRTPYMPYARGQGRGNSGVYIQQRYEVQILDSFGLDGLDNECGGLYKQQAPDLNMCLPPLSWQTYDIYFAAPQWNSDGSKLVPANITVLHNGVPIHFNYRLKDKTGGGTAEGPKDLPILLQNHGNPVTFRNIWIAPLIPVASEGWYSGECVANQDILTGESEYNPMVRGRLFGASR